MTLEARDRGRFRGSRFPSDTRWVTRDRAGERARARASIVDSCRSVLESNQGGRTFVVRVPGSRVPSAPSTGGAVALCASHVERIDVVSAMQSELARFRSLVRSQIWAAPDPRASSWAAVPLQWCRHTAVSVQMPAGIRLGYARRHHWIKRGTAAPTTVCAAAPLY